MKIKLKSKRFPYIRAGIRFKDGQAVEVEVSNEQLKALRADPHIIMADKNSQPPLRKWDAGKLAAAIFDIFKSFKDEDFKKDGGLKVDAVRSALSDEDISVAVLDEAMPLVFAKIEGEHEHGQDESNGDDSETDNGEGK